MAYRLRCRTFYALARAAGLLSLSVLFSLESRAETSVSNILLRRDTAAARRDELTSKLRAITGWHSLEFDERGTLRLGRGAPAGGSESARQLLRAAAAGGRVLVLEDASDRADVVFCRVVEGRWTQGADGKPPAFVILIDFTDFSRVTGDRAALAAFNVGWGVLHEVDHVVRDSVDPDEEGAAGECEDAINRMRRECGLAERAEYFFTHLPGTTASDFVTRHVRLAFDLREPATGKKKRYWVVWDAALVGGLGGRKQVAAWR